MISSVIAKFNCDEQVRQQAMKQIARHSALGMGELIEGRNLPITIEAVGNQETEEITRWIMSLDGVDFVDVVYVCFEDEDINLPVAKKRKTENQSQ